MKTYATLETPEDRKSRIFGERARRLARNAIREDVKDDQMEIVEFSLGDERYAVESRYTGEVFSHVDITPIPCTPRFVAGVVNLRGRIVSVVDLKALFGIPAQETRKTQRIVILRSDSMEIGLLVDGIPGIATVSPAGLHSPMATLTGVRGMYTLGIERDDLAVLDGAKILGDGSLLVNEEP